MLLIRHGSLVTYRMSSTQANDPITTLPYNSWHLEHYTLPAGCSKSRCAWNMAPTCSIYFIRDTNSVSLFSVGNSCWRGNKIPVLRWNRPLESSALVSNSRSLKAYGIKLKVRKENHYSKQNIYLTFPFEAHWLLCESSVLKLRSFWIFAM